MPLEPAWREFLEAAALIEPIHSERFAAMCAPALLRDKQMLCSNKHATAQMGARAYHCTANPSSHPLFAHDKLALCLIIL